MRSANEAILPSSPKNTKFKTVFFRMPQTKKWKTKNETIATPIRHALGSGKHDNTDKC